MKRAIIKAIGIILVFSCVLSLLTGCNGSEKASLRTTLAFSALEYKEDVLTDGEIYGRQVILAEGRDVAGFHEITEDEYNEAMSKLSEEVKNV